MKDTALITKKVIAYAFKDLAKSQDLNKISITQIMQHAEYRRQTFYDHFLDKEDLIIWIYEQEMTELIEHFLYYEHWTKIIFSILTYFKKNNTFYDKLLKSDYSLIFQKAFLAHINQFIINLLERESLIDSYDTFIKEEQIILFYVHGLTHTIQDWIINHCQESIDEINNNLIFIINNGLLHTLALNKKNIQTHQ